MIIITATLSFETEKDRNETVAKTADVQAATRNDEVGSQAYSYAPDPAEPTHIQVYELCTDPNNLAAQ